MTSVLKLLVPALALASALTTTAGGCGDDGAASQEGFVKVYTETDAEWAQYSENLRFALSYEPTCVVATPPGSESPGPEGAGGAGGGGAGGEGGGGAEPLPRVLVTGYGRFGYAATNATGQAVAELLPELEYPFTERPPAGEVDPPGPQTAVAHGVVELPMSGPVEVCAMVLPVYWDLAALLVAAELAAFRPDFVMMNGIAGSRQPLWIELGSVNRAMGTTDGSDVLAPEHGAPLIPEAPEEDELRGLLLSWETVRGAALDAIEEHRDDLEGTAPLEQLLEGALLAGYPRPSNTYLCNNVAYTVGYLMDHGDQTFTLLEASEPRDDAPAGIDVSLGADFSQVPRVFVHWPSSLKGAHLRSAAEIMKAMIDAQLVALGDADDLPTRGSNDVAELAGSPGSTY